MSGFTPQFLEATSNSSTIYDSLEAALDYPVASKRSFPNLTPRDFAAYTNCSGFGGFGTGIRSSNLVDIEVSLDIESYYAYDLPLVEPSTSNLEHSESGQHSAPAKVKLDKNITPQTDAQREFGGDLSNRQDLPANEAHPPETLPEPSSRASKLEVKAPTGSTSSDTAIGTSSSSSPARKSARQRKNAIPSSSSTVKMGKPPVRSRRVTTRSTAPPAEQLSSICKGCGVDFFSVSDKDRHAMSNHIRFREQCPGCLEIFSRYDSLKRHIESETTDESCRSAAKADGWQEKFKDGTIKYSKPGRTNRREIVAAYGY